MLTLRNSRWFNESHHQKRIPVNIEETVARKKTSIWTFTSQNHSPPIKCKTNLRKFVKLNRVPPEGKRVRAVDCTWISNQVGPFSSPLAQQRYYTPPLSPTNSNSETLSKGSLDETSYLTTSPFLEAAIAEKYPKVSLLNSLFMVTFGWQYRNSRKSIYSTFFSFFFSKLTKPSSRTPLSQPKWNYQFFYTFSWHFSAIFCPLTSLLLLLSKYYWPYHYDFVSYVFLSREDAFIFYFKWQSLQY